MVVMTKRKLLPFSVLQVALCWPVNRLAQDDEQFLKKTLRHDTGLLKERIASGADINRQIDIGKANGAK